MTSSSAPYFSIILPTYNRAHLVSISIKSVINQSFTNWELLIIDDGSTDNTALVLQPFLSDPRIYYHYQHNQERSAARNNGIKKAKGKFICFLDSDDYYLANHLEAIYRSIQEHKEAVALYYTQCQFNTDGLLTTPKPLGTIKGKGIYNVLNNSLLLTNSISVHSELLTLNKFPEHLSIFEDNHLWIRLICQSKLISIHETTNIVVEHKQRSLHYAANELDRKTEKYMAAINDLFYSGKYQIIDQCISESEKRSFIASKYIVMAFDALHQSSLKLLYKYVFLSLTTKFEFKNLSPILKLSFLGWAYMIFKKTQ